MPGPALRERPATPASIGRSRGEEARPASSEARIALLRSVAWLRHPAAALLPGRHIRLCRASEDRRSVQAIGRGRPTERNPFHISYRGRLPDRTRIGSLSDLQAQRFLNFQDPASGDPAVAVSLGSGSVVAFDAVCTHAGCQVGYDASQRLLSCPCHGAVLDPSRAATVVSGPAPTALPAIRVQVGTDGGVYAG